MCDLPLIRDKNVIRGMESLDDAGVYKLSDNLAIIQTIDFFTPIVNDPYAFGQIAAANALSDVYAMGGKPLTAMNIVCFPSKTLDISVLQDILKGGIDKRREAGVVLVGGHSIDDKELKYGLSVTGTVHPKRLLTNSGARVGDKLILTKPLGTGIINTALKAGLADEKTIDKTTRYMASLNKEASELMQEFEVHSCTDITGFGLLGHASHLVRDGQAGIELNSASIPVFHEAVDFVKQGLYPGGGSCNREYYGPLVEFAGYIPDYQQDILFDPQTSGGLLIALDPKDAERLVKKLHQTGVPQAAVIGKLINQPKSKIQVR